MDTKIDVLISKMEQSRAQLNAAIAKIAPQADIYPSWKLKQVLDHITGWDELTISSIRAYSKQEALPMTVKHGINQFNAESVEARKSLSLEQSRQAYDVMRQQGLQSLREMPTEMLSQRFQAPWGGMCTIASVVKIFVGHEIEHAKQIEEILEKRSNKD